MQRRTKQRQAILDFLQRRDFHPTAEEIFDAVKQAIPSISLGTVYRNLEGLVDDGAVIRIDGTSPARFEGAAKVHLHMRCDSCGKICDIWPTSPVLNRDALPDEFVITGWDLLLHGLCPDCVAQRRQSDQVRVHTIP